MKLAGVLTRYEDQSQSHSVGQLRSVLQETAYFYRDVSYGLIGPIGVGAAAGEYVIPGPRPRFATVEECYQRGVSWVGDASRYGVADPNTADGTHWFFTISCTGGGHANLGGGGFSNGVIHLAGPSVDVAAHELGHIFGLPHAHGYRLTGNLHLDVQSGYGLVERGDSYDIMGGGSVVARSFAAFRRNQFGWLPAARELKRENQVLVLADVNAVSGERWVKIPRADGIPYTVELAGDAWVLRVPYNSLRYVNALRRGDAWHDALGGFAFAVQDDGQLRIEVFAPLVEEEPEPVPVPPSSPTPPPRPVPPPHPPNPLPLPQKEKNMVSLHNGRFEVQVKVKDARVPGATATAERWRGDQTALFTFFDSGNLEIFVSVLDARGTDGHWWVKQGGATDVGLLLTVLDTTTGKRWERSNLNGEMLRPEIDRRAFPA